MAEEELIPFDPSMKKKKKKKKGAFDPDGGILEPEEPQPKEQPEVEEEKVDKPLDDFGKDLSSFDPNQKKKKKKKITMDELNDALPDTESKDVPMDNFDSGSLDGLDTFSGKKRKSKKPKAVTILDEDDDTEITGTEEGENESSHSHLSWHGSDRDYSYDELLTRVFDIIREKNPEMIAGEKKKFVMRPPQVLKVGTRKTSFANFSDICRLVHRQPKHVLAFLLAELGTSGSVDGNNQLIIRGRYNQKQIENVLRGYIKEYVTCHTCRSPDTLLQKDTRLFFLQCETCGSRCSVASIKSGFQAVTGRRAAMRARTT